MARGASLGSTSIATPGAELIRPTAPPEKMI
jgi:hypothetical protein